jgi:hypothetical protein
MCWFRGWWRGWLTLRDYRSNLLFFFISSGMEIQHNIQLYKGLSWMHHDITSVRPQGVPPVPVLLKMIIVQQMSLLVTLLKNR